MPRLRTVRTKEEAEAVPVDQSINVDLAEQEEAVAATEEKVDGQQAKKDGGSKAPADDVVAGDAAEAPEENKELSALQKRVQELERAEKLQKEQYEARIREAEAARRKAEREASEKVSKYQGEAEDANYDALQAALAAANADAEVAQRALEIADETADTKAKAKAYRDLSIATARITQLEDGKLAYERSREERKANPPKAAEEHPDDRFEAAIANFPPTAKAWLRARPQYLTDTQKNADLQYFHQTVIGEGKVFDTPEYYESLEIHLGERAKPQPPPEPVEDDPEVEVVAAPQRSKVVSQAPPSRDVPSAGSGQRHQSTKVTLSPEERDIAERAGISPVEYAKQKVRLAQMKANGFYTEK